MEVLAWAPATIIGLELSAAVGLNITLPVLVAAVLARTGNVILAPGFDLLSRTWAIAILCLIVAVEVTAGKYVSEPSAPYFYIRVPDVEGAAAGKGSIRPRVTRLLTFPLAAATAVMIATAVAQAPRSHGPTGLGLVLLLTASAVVAFGAQIIRVTLRSSVQARDWQVPISACEDVASLLVAFCALLIPVPFMLAAGVLLGVVSRREQVREILRRGLLAEALMASIRRAVPPGLR